MASRRGSAIFRSQCPFWAKAFLGPKASIFTLNCFLEDSAGMFSMWACKCVHTSAWFHYLSQKVFPKM